VPATRELDADAILNTALAVGIDSALIVQLNNAYVDRSAIGATDPRRALVFDRNVVQLELSLYELRSNQRLWLATSNTSGNLLTSVDTLFFTFIDSAVRQAAKDGVLP
jgi:hypothetical protein